METTKNTTVLDGNITTAQLQTWKSKYGKLIKVSVDNDESEKCYAYFRKPTMATRAAVLQTSKADEFKALEVLFKNCFLGGDQEIEIDDDLKLSVITAFADVTQPKEATAKKDLDPFLISELAGEDEILKAAALIRYYFKVDPYQQNDEQFLRLIGEALWLQEYLDKKQEYVTAKALAKIFGEDD